MTMHSKYIDITMELVPLCSKQRLLFREGFPQDFGVFLSECLPLHPIEHLFDGIWVRPVKLAHTKLHVFMDLVLSTRAQSCWNRKGPSTNCSHKFGTIALSKMSWYGESLRFPITGRKGISNGPLKNSHNPLSILSNVTDGTIHSGR